MLVTVQALARNRVTYHAMLVPGRGSEDGVVVLFHIFVHMHMDNTGASAFHIAHATADVGDEALEGGTSRGGVHLRAGTGSRHDSSLDTTSRTSQDMHVRPALLVGRGELVAVGASVGGRRDGAAPVMEAKDDTLAHDHGDGLPEARSARLGGDGRDTEHDQVQDVDASQKKEVR